MYLNKTITTLSSHKMNHTVNEIVIETTKGTVVLIDTSYFVFYRYFATFNWFRRQETEDVRISVDAIMNNNAFVEKYSKMFVKTLADIQKKYKVTHPSNLILVRDCPRDSIWRHQYFDAYKGNRDEKTKTFNKEVFFYTYNTLLPKLQQEIGFVMLGHHCLEADDVVGVICKRLLDVSPSIDIVIITNDNDYIQLLSHLNLKSKFDTHKLRIINMQDKSICDRVGCSPEHYLLIKKILGDKSDNIPSIAKKCGEKTAMKLAMSPELLATMLNSDENTKRKFELNELLVDFKHIPQIYQEDVLKRVHFVL